MPNPIFTKHFLSDAIKEAQEIGDSSNAQIMKQALELILDQERMITTLQGEISTATQTANKLYAIIGSLQPPNEPLPITGFTPTSKLARNLSYGEHLQRTDQCTPLRIASRIA